MDTETRITTYAGLVLVAVAILIPAVQNADQFSRGSPPKFLRDTYLGPIDVLDDLAPRGRADGDDVVRLAVGDKSYGSLTLEHVVLRNEGKTPIVPTDFIEPLRVNAAEPWNIIAIRRGTFAADPTIVNIEWIRKGPQQFEARPFLLNPGESVFETVYVTRRAGVPLPPEPRGPPIFVTMRVVNLVGFSGEPKWKFTDEPRPRSLVYLTVGGTAFVVIFAAILLCWYIWALSKLGLNRYSRPRMVFAIVACATLSYATAEVVAFYIFPGDPEYGYLRGEFFDWRDQLQNWIVLATHAVVTAVLFRKLRIS